MTIERQSPGDSERPNDPPSTQSGTGGVTHERTANVEHMRRWLRLRLERHLDVDGFRPAMTIFGARGIKAEAVRIGLEHPENAMVGFTLPAKYSSIGVVASSTIAVRPSDAHEDAAIALAVHRSADAVSMVATTSRGVTETSAEQGWLFDACHRALGLASPPCATASLELPLALWLDRVMVSMINAPAAQPLRWDHVADLCPIPRRWRSPDPIDLGTTLGSTTRSWKALRTTAGQGLPSLVSVTPSWAQWMDDPMFARWCLGSFPDLADLRNDVAFLAPDVVVENLELATRAAWLAFAQ